ncbi:enoyl-CoA hydratase [Bradyrhizobium sp. USDA 4509]
MSAHVSISSEDSVFRIRVQRPDKLNAYSPAMCAAICVAWEKFNESEDLVAVISGTEKSFTAGADLTSLTATGGQGWRIHQAVPNVVARVEKPVISAVSGWCVGVGMYLTQATDLIVATRTAKFSYPEAKIGMGGSWVPSASAARFPLKIAMELALLPDAVDAERAYSVGMVNRLVEVGEEEAVAMGLARRICENSPRANRHIIEHIRRFGPQSMPDITASAPDFSALGMAEGREGSRAMVERRKPNFAKDTGRLPPEVYELAEGALDDRRRGG